MDSPTEAQLSDAERGCNYLREVGLAALADMMSSLVAALGEARTEVDYEKRQCGEWMTISLRNADLLEKAEAEVKRLKAMLEKLAVYEYAQGLEEKVKSMEADWADDVRTMESLAKTAEKLEAEVASLKAEVASLRVKLEAFDLAAQIHRGERDEVRGDLREALDALDACMDQVAPYTLGVIPYQQIRDICAPVLRKNGRL